MASLRSSGHRSGKGKDKKPAGGRPAPAGAIDPRREPRASRPALSSLRCSLICPSFPFIGLFGCSLLRNISDNCSVAALH
ncbi:unnamed protein product [Caenorhabditis auriculariae]|uniref:Uncharacterized protein n=1 Tax=Caenorhabditis auriculariae TaxID=2777116 RepID=A0A8S1HMA5_9PELO|nr:unnamed protein product [Caenorhabditis auriculariae]